jgi:hypothetical protein
MYIILWISEMTLSTSLRNFLSSSPSSSLGGGGRVVVGVGVCSASSEYSLGALRRNNQKLMLKEGLQSRGS